MESLLLAWYRTSARDLPWRRTRDPYAILVSEVMLQQTQVERVIPRYLEWLERWPTVSTLAAATPADVIREWQGLGYNRRAVNLHRTVQSVARDGWPGGTRPTQSRGSRTNARCCRSTRTFGASSTGRAEPSARSRHTRSWISARRSAWR